MDHLAKEKQEKLSRFGFHYIYDVDRYQISDAKFWLRKLRGLSAKWLVLRNPKNRAIPEDFIRELAKNGITIIVDFAEKIGSFTDITEIETLLRVYGKWGVRYACLFKEPNCRQQWGETKWLENDIVSVHADHFLAFARTCNENKIQPVFSTLHPEGEFSDLAFLERSLEFIKQEADPIVLKKLVLGAYGWHFSHPLDWGAGGSQRWPKTSFTKSPPSTEDNRGFRLFEWYAEISYKTLGRKLPIIILEAGKAGGELSMVDENARDWSGNFTAMIYLLANRNVFDQSQPDVLCDPIGPEVIACCVFLLSADNEKNLLPYRWFSLDGKPLSSAAQLLVIQNVNIEYPQEIPVNEIGGSDHSYQRYLFIDQTIKAQTQKILEKIDPYLKKHKPIIGFSLLDGNKAAYLVIITDDKERFLEESRHLMPAQSITKIVALSELKEFALT